MLEKLTGIIVAAGSSNVDLGCKVVGKKQECGAT